LCYRKNNVLVGSGRVERDLDFDLDQQATDQVERSVADGRDAASKTPPIGAVRWHVVPENRRRIERCDEVDSFGPVITLSHVTATTVSQ